MGVTIIKTNSKQLLANFGVYPGDAQALMDAGIKALCTNKAVKFVKDGEVLSSAAVPHGALKAAQNKKITGTSAELIKAQLTSAIAEALAQAAAPEGGSTLLKVKKQKKKMTWGTGSPMKSAHDDGIVAVDIAFDTPHAEPYDPPVAAIPDDEFAPYPPSYMKSGSRLKLKDATRLYQPVHGTGDNSRYFLIAATDDLKIACRYQGSKMSVRVEGDIPKYKHRLIAVGFAVSNVQYTSMHLKIDDDTLAAKTIGSIIIGLEVPMRTDFPSVKVIKDMGNT